MARAPRSNLHSDVVLGVVDPTYIPGRSKIYRFQGNAVRQRRKGRRGAVRIDRLRTSAADGCPTVKSNNGSLYLRELTCSSGVFLEYRSSMVPLVGAAAATFRFPRAFGDAGDLTAHDSAGPAD